MNMKHILSLCLLALVLTSCDDYLDVSPDNRQELKTLENLQELLVTAYSEGSYNFIEYKTDNAFAIDDNTQKAWMTENFQYVPVVSDEGQDTPTYLWTNTYYAISHANQALHELDKVPNTDQDRYDAVKGEALITRAYNHFILANVFCQAYDPATAASELGIPYPTSPEGELLVKYDRGTLQQTYDQIEKDLLEALPLIKDEFYKGSGKYHFNKQAAYAFASRFFLFKKDDVNCIKYSNMLLGEGTPNPILIRDMEVVFSGNNVKESAANFNDVLDPSNLMVVRKMSWIGRPYWGYQSNDALFGKLFGESVQGGVKDHRDSRWNYGTDAIIQPKYGELFEFTTANTGYAYTIQPDLRAEEVIFNRMEAYVNTNRIGEALADYNIFAPSRYEGGGQLTIDQIKDFYELDEQEAMMQFIISERRKEFLREGLRWWDIKRFDLPVTHIDIMGNKFTLDAKDLKKAVQIPAGPISQGIQANPR